jgi:hypothetical protein
MPYPPRSNLAKWKDAPLEKAAEDIQPIKMARQTASQHELLMNV